MGTIESAAKANNVVACSRPIADMIRRLTDSSVPCAHARFRRSETALNDEVRSLRQCSSFPKR